VVEPAKIVKQNSNSKPSTSHVQYEQEKAQESEDDHDSDVAGVVVCRYLEPEPHQDGT
jgi:hypothetical protein